MATQACLAIAISLLPAMVLGQAASPSSAATDFYGAVHFREVAERLTAVRAYALARPLGIDLAGHVDGGHKARTAASILMVYTYQSIVENGLQVHQHVISLSQDQGPLSEPFAATLAAYVLRILPLGSSAMTLRRAQDGTLVMVARLTPAEHEAYAALPLQPQPEPLEQVILECVLNGRTFSIKPIAPDAEP